MRIKFLGTGGYHPNDRRHTAGILLPETSVVFDAGTSAFRIPGELDTDDVHIFLSHAHLDHTVGLTYLLVPMLHGDIRRARVYGTQPTLDAVRRHLFAEQTFPVMPDFEYIQLESLPKVDLPHGGRLTHHPLPSHPGGSTAFRIDWAGITRQRRRSLAYVTDTSVDGSYTEFVAGVDVLIHECYFPDDRAELGQRTGHSHLSAVTHLARQAAVGRLILTHIDPQSPGDNPIDLKAARTVFPNTEIAEDLWELEF